MCEACDMQRPKVPIPKQEPPVLHTVRAGRTFRVGKAQIAVAMEDATLIVGAGGTGIFKAGSHGEVQAGGNFTAEDGAHVTARYASAGRALSGSTIIKEYGASIAVDEGAIIHEIAASEYHAPPGAKKVSYAKLDDGVKALMDLARESSRRAHFPYSKEFPVGAAVLAENADGDHLVFWGTNIESKSCYVCAERSAIFEAVKNGYKKILKLAVYCPKDPGGQQCTYCKAFLREFGLDGEVYNLFNEEGIVTCYTVRQLLRMPKGAAPAGDLRDESVCRQWLEAELGASGAIWSAAPGLFAEIDAYWGELWKIDIFQRALSARTLSTTPAVAYDDLAPVWEVVTAHGMDSARAENLLRVLSPSRQH